MSDQKKNDHPLEDMLSQLQDALSQAVDAAGQDQGTSGDEQASAPGEQQISDLLPGAARSGCRSVQLHDPAAVHRSRKIRQSRGSRPQEGAPPAGLHPEGRIHRRSRPQRPLHCRVRWCRSCACSRCPTGRIKILVQGASRAKVEGYHRVEPYLEARITVPQEETPPRDAKIEALLRSAVSRAKRCSSCAAWPPRTSWPCSRAWRNRAVWPTSSPPTCA